MSELPEELKTLAPDTHWDEKRDTFYVRARGLASSDIPGFIQRFRQVLTTDPENMGVRFLLANYLEMSKQHQEARAELERVARSGDEAWSAKARQMLETLPEPL